MAILFWISLAILYYVYDGYLRLLLLVTRLTGASEPSFPEPNSGPPRVTVLLTVFNEQDVIEKRIENILQCEYPRDNLEILVASDGSTDRTDDLVKNFHEQGVILFRPLERKGKTDTQNQAVEKATGDILVFTDAGTTFDKQFLMNIVRPFSDPAVGGVSGRCLFSSGDTGITESQDFYWRFELRLRELESNLGILAVSTGACVAVRKVLFKPMEAIYGEDCVLPLDVVLQGYEMKHCNAAVAYDTWAGETGSEFKTRVRMTLRNWQGTWSRSGLLNPLRYPGIALALWSHKLLRWLSPVFLMIMTITAVVMAIRGNQEFQLIGLAMVLVYLCGAAGWWVQSKGLRLPVVTKIYSFLLANAGFLVGLWRSLSGHTVRAYRN